MRWPCVHNYKYNVNYVSPNSNKAIDLFLRTSTNFERKSVAIHRLELVKHLKKILEKNNLTGEINGKRLSKSKFENKMRETKIMPSPFGWGEIGVRDYEAFINGSLLL